jgi:choline dehydrogenase
MSGESDTCDYIVVGSGAGGGTLAARLAEAGMHVILLEAGEDPRQTNVAGLPENYEVPSFHPLASEQQAMRWDFFVRHYRDDAEQRRSESQQRHKSAHDPRGIYYPRAGTLGGCTAHNAMIFVAPHDNDWNDIAKLTGDASWHASKMRLYMRKLENCRYKPMWRMLSRVGIDPTRRGWNGWLHTEWAHPRKALGDNELVRNVVHSACTAMLAARHPLRSLRSLLTGIGDPNFRLPGQRTFEGVCFTPLSTSSHRRLGTRERILEVAKQHPNKLEIRLHALATRVILDGQKRATGVEYLHGERLYRAAQANTSAGGTPCKVFARREVIIAGGVFNSPQLLMLSGIGPKAELESHKIEAKVDLPGVGSNLQDRYEIGVVNRLAGPWPVLKGAQFKAGDPLYLEWESQQTGMYTSNGAAVAVIQRSHPKNRDPDLFLMALIGKFYGYFVGYSDVIVKSPNYLTWAILKAHTLNRAGTVTLCSDNPRHVPKINFNYFDRSNDPNSEDLQAVIKGIRFARRLVDSVNGHNPVMTEEIPGRHLQSDQQLADYVRDNAWGHHACGTCAIGPRESSGVVDKDFKVHGTHRLRVVDASVFPRIPGFFIVSAVYMIAEKAADSILADSRRK